MALLLPLLKGPASDEELQGETVLEADAEVTADASYAGEARAGTGEEIAEILAALGWSDCPGFASLKLVDSGVGVLVPVPTTDKGGVSS